MIDPIELAEELMAKARELPSSPTKTALLEEAIQYADSAHNIPLGYELRTHLMLSATLSGRPDIMLVAFAWCLAQFDRDPGSYDRFRLLWYYKWVSSNCLGFPAISLSRVQELFVDMERRFREAGSTMNGVSQLQRRYFMHVGDREGAKIAHSQLRKRRRDRLSDCIACAASANCDYYCFQRQWKRAVQAAEPVLSGCVSCNEQPCRILADVLLPLLRLGRYEEAKENQRRGYRLLSKKSHIDDEHGQHVQCVALLGDLNQAQRLVERHLQGALDSVELRPRFDFFLAARLWTDRLLERGTKTVKGKLPIQTPNQGAQGVFDVSALGEWFVAQAELIARQFDARNGTDAFQQKIDELPKLLKLAVDG